MSNFFTCNLIPLLFTFFRLVHSAENSGDLSAIIELEIQSLVNLAYDNEKTNEFGIKVGKFALSFSVLDEPNVPKITYHQLVKQPVEFLMKFTTVLSDLFSSDRESSMRQICDALILRNFFLVLEEFSIQNLTEEQIQIGKKIHDFIFEINSYSKVGTSHLGIVLEEFLNRRDPEDIILFTLFECEAETIKRYTALVKKKFDYKFNFKFLINCVSSAIQFYEGHLNIETPIFEKIFFYSHRIKCSFTEFVFQPIMNLKYGAKTFKKLVKVVETYGKVYIFQIIRHFPFRFQFTYFKILAKPKVSLLSPYEAQNFLYELKMLLSTPHMWIIASADNHTSSILTYVRSHYLPQFPPGTIDNLLLEKLIWILKKENISVFYDELKITTG